MFRINQNEMDSSFRIPSSIVDKHIRLANEHQLKVLLWIMRNSPENPDIDEMCKALKMKADDAYDYLQYWVLTGVLLCDDSPAPEKKTSAQKPAAKAADTAVKKSAPVTVAPVAPAVKAVSGVAPVIEYSKPSIEEIAARIDESSEISHLFREAQVKLGKTIGYDMQCVLLMLHDYDGLPVEVIFMLLDYCVSIGKTNNAYLSALGRNWGDNEIDTIEKADEKIAKLNSTNRVWKDFAEMANITNPKPTKAQTEYFAKWNGEYKFSPDMIYLAYEEMADHTTKMSFPYMDKVLINWHEQEITTPAQLEAHKKAVSDAKKKTAKPEKEKKTKSSASYDIEAFKQAALNDDLQYERKKKK
ncbi:MAG: DnaD domain protein [Clostridia bacterium]|nr:DnaD domain protein [Clostridia bacterium]